MSAFYDSHHGLNNAVALPRVWEFNLPSRYERYADLADAMGVNTNGMSTVQKAEAALEAAIQLSKDLGVPENFAAVGDHPKTRMGVGTDEDKGSTIAGDDRDVDRISEHIMGDTCTPGNPRECTVEPMKPVVRETLTGVL